MSATFTDDLNFEAPQRTVPANPDGSMGPTHKLVPVSDAGTIMAVIARAAADPNTDVDKLERLMAMYERIEGAKAKAAYDEALAQMQPELPAIEKRGAIKNSSGNVQSTYAKWEHVNEAIKPVLHKHGFGLSFRVECGEKIRVTGVLSHRLGHREETTITLPADTSGSKNAVQAVASSVSYGKRYTAGALLNLTSYNEDDDGMGAQRPSLSDKELGTLRDMLAEWSPSPEEMKRFTGWLGVADPEDMDPKKFPDAVKALRAKIGGKK